MAGIGIIGTGVVGSAVALLLQHKGYTITGVCSKTGISAAQLARKLGCRFMTDPTDVLPEAELVFLTVPDREISSLAEVLAGSGLAAEGQVFLHMSGALPAEILSPLKEKGAQVGSLHPLQAFANVEKAMENLPGSYFAVQGDTKAADISFKLVRDFGGLAFLLKSGDKALYHLGACVASNYLVSVIHYAINIYREIGMSENQARDALFPLIKGTLANIELLGPAKALTGPVARGDLDTIKQHLAAVAGLDTNLADVYSALGKYTTRVALEKGSINPETAGELLNTLEMGEKDSASQ